MTEIKYPILDKLLSKESIERRRTQREESINRGIGAFVGDIVDWRVRETMSRLREGKRII